MSTRRWNGCWVLEPSAGTVLAATDLSDAALPAVRAAIAHARRLRCPLVLLHVVDLNALLMAPDIAGGVPLPLTDNLRRSILLAAQRRFHKALRAKRLKGDAIVAAGAPASAILDQAACQNARLIVMGTEGATGLKRMLLGSVAEAVVRRAECSTLVVRLS